MCGFIAQLVEHRTGIAEVTGSNPVEALIFFRLLRSNCLNWKIYCDDHSSLSSTTTVRFLLDVLPIINGHLCGQICQSVSRHLVCILYTYLATPNWGFSGPL